MSEIETPTITLDVDQANRVVQAEMIWHLMRQEDTDDKVLKAMKKVLRYYSSDEEWGLYKDMLLFSGSRV